MSKAEEQTIRNVIQRLKGEGASQEVKAALTGPAAIYLNTWVIGALECLLPESRDLRLAVQLSGR